MRVLILDKKKLALFMAATIFGYILVVTAPIPELRMVGAIIIIISLYYTFNYVIRKQRLKKKKSSSD